MITESVVIEHTCDGCNNKLDGEWGHFTVHKGGIHILGDRVELYRSIFCDKPCFDRWCDDIAKNKEYNRKHPGFVGMGM